MACLECASGWVGNARCLCLAAQGGWVRGVLCPPCVCGGGGAVAVLVVLIWLGGGGGRAPVRHQAAAAFICLNTTQLIFSPHCEYVAAFRQVYLCLFSMAHVSLFYRSRWHRFVPSPIVIYLSCALRYQLPGQVW